MLNPLMLLGYLILAGGFLSAILEPAKVAGEPKTGEKPKAKPEPVESSPPLKEDEE